MHGTKPYRKAADFSLHHTSFIASLPEQGLVALKVFKEQGTVTGKEGDPRKEYLMLKDIFTSVEIYRESGKGIKS